MNIKIEIKEMPITNTNTDPVKYSISVYGEGSEKECEDLKDYLCRLKKNDDDEG